MAHDPASSEIKLPRIVGITGAAGAGKDTVAEVLVILGARRYGFADPLKLALNAIFGWTIEMWDDREWKETPQEPHGRSPRYLAQTIGTEWGRDLVHPNLWVMVAAELKKNDARPWVLADVRFPNEAKWIRDAGGVIIEVIRPGHEPIEGNHVSEVGLERGLIDHTIINDRGINDLRDEVIKLLRKIDASPQI